VGWPAQVLTTEGEDVSAQFLDGAGRRWRWCKTRHPRRAQGQQPSCGNLLTYDGTFSGVKVTVKA
jgi:uncharacterized protein YbbK (DUF523 family)